MTINLSNSNIGIYFNLFNIVEMSGNHNQTSDRALEFWKPLLKPVRTHKLQTSTTDTLSCI